MGLPGPPGRFLACAKCLGAVKPKEKGARAALPRLALGRMHAQVVPTCRLSCVGTRDVGAIQLLARPSIVMHQMLSVYRTNSLIIRLLSSSVLDRMQQRGGNLASAEPGATPCLTGDSPKVQLLQRAQRRHIITFRNCIDELRQKVAAGVVDGTVSKGAVLKNIKVVLCGPQYSKKQLVQAALAGTTFDVDPVVLQDWLDVLEAYHLPEFYGPEAAAASRVRQKAVGDPAAAPGDRGEGDSEESDGEAWDHDNDAFMERCVVFSEDNKEAADRFLRGIRGEGTAYCNSHHDAPADEDSDPRRVFTDVSGVVSMGTGSFNDVDIIQAGVENHEADLAKERVAVAANLKCAGCSKTSSPCTHCACMCLGHGHRPGQCRLTAGGARPERLIGANCSSCTQLVASSAAKAATKARPELPDFACVRGDAPINEFHESDLISGANAPLFPNGRGLHRDRRRDIQYSVSVWRRHLAGLSNRVYAQHHSFLFDVADMYNRHQVLRKAKILANAPSGQDHIMQLKDLKAVVKDMKRFGVPGGLKRHPNVYNLLRNIRAVGGSVVGSPYARGQYGKTLRGMQTVLGKPSIWLTVNLHDLGASVVGGRGRRPLLLCSGLVAGLLSWDVYCPSPSPRRRYADCLYVLAPLCHLQRTRMSCFSVGPSA